MLVAARWVLHTFNKEPCYLLAWKKERGKQKHQPTEITMSESWSVWNNSRRYGSGPRASIDKVEDAPSNNIQ